ncbi:MAG: glucosaminidase domain-containing protein [Bacteroidota bacterium]
MNSVDYRLNYIEEHKDLAVIEMHRKGIPASIKLAQAILESDSGTSQFSLESHNHFGIKCKKYWRGEKVMHIDDDTDANGDLTESCFRAYEDVFHSYVDHSNFVAHSDNYRPLFDLDPQDYKAWARGLQEQGYATDPKYAEKLIAIIEKHQLYEYDRL